MALDFVCVIEQFLHFLSCRRVGRLKDKRRDRRVSTYVEDHELRGQSAG